MAGKRGGLGKGLDSLFNDNIIEESDNVRTLRISELEPNRNQPRKEFDPAALAELADSIAAVGVIQPLIVRPIPSGGYQIVAGERRWRAAQSAGLTEVPVVIRELNDKEVDEIALIENLQREDLPLECHYKNGSGVRRKVRHHCHRHLSRRKDLCRRRRF